MYNVRLWSVLVTLDRSLSTEKKIDDYQSNVDHKSCNTTVERETVSGTANYTPHFCSSYDYRNDLSAPSLSTHRSEQLHRQLPMIIYSFEGQKMVQHALKIHCLYEF